jgi:hypothetical protein
LFRFWSDDRAIEQEPYATTIKATQIAAPKRSIIPNSPGLVL